MPYCYSPLRYPGGKTKIYSTVRELLEHNGLLGETYIEPFAGGAGLAIKLLLNKDVKRIVLNDYDPAIYAFWYSVLNYSEKLIDNIITTDITPNEWKKQKEIYSDQNKNDILSLGFATFFLNRTNRSGILSGGIIGGVNQNGNYLIDARFNKSDLINKISTISKLKDRIILSNMDASEFLEPHNLNSFYKAFINLDPPYVKKGARLYKNSFTEEEHRVLCQKISSCGRKWIVTYDVCSLVAELYNDYRCSYLDVTYSIQKNKKAQEYIFFSNNLNIPEHINLL